MGLVIRAVVIYMFLLILFRLSGKRSLAQLTTIDFVLLLMIGEATESAIMMDDNSVLGAMLVIGTLVFLDLFLAKLSTRFDLVDKVANGVPVIILKDGVILQERMEREGIEVDDILEFARMDQGLESLDQVKYAVLEKDGQISIIPK